MHYEGLGFDFKAILKKRYLLYLLASVVLFGYSFHFVSGKQDMINNIRKDIQKTERRLGILKDFQTKHKDFPAYKKSLELRYEVSRKLLPMEFNNQVFLASLDESAQGISLSNVIFPAKQDVTKLKSESRVELYPVKIQFQGDYFAVLDFLKKLEKKHYILENLRVKADKVGYLEGSLLVNQCVVKEKKT